MEYHKRKHPRLKDFDYSTNGVYFITICTIERQTMLCDIVGRDDPGTPYIIQLTPEGKITDKYINSISTHYQNVSVDKYIIMPDHIHLLLSITGERRVESPRPTDISQIIGVLKRLINKDAGKNIFQTAFYDQIIRDENDYMIQWNYLENNPMKWVNKVGEHK